MGTDPATKKPLPFDQFQIPIKDIHISWPDYEEALQFPSIVLLSGRGQYMPLGMGDTFDNETEDKYKRGTIVQLLSEYVEDFTIEIWANKRPELRSIVAGIEAALSPNDGQYGIRFRVPAYFNQLVLFTISDINITEDADSAMNRRKARMSMQMRFNQCALVNYAKVTPFVSAVVDGLADGEAIVLVELEERIEDPSEAREDECCPET